MLIQKGIRAWSVLQVVALFLPGRFMRRYLSPLVAELVFIVVPHGFLDICLPVFCPNNVSVVRQKAGEKEEWGISLKTPNFCPNL